MMARLLMLLLLLASVIGATGDTPTSMPEEVSLMQLIATPERYDGKQVQVVGFLRLEFEGNGLYLHEEDYKHSITKNSLWIVRNPRIDMRSKALDMHYVMLIGTFTASRKGHMNLFSGSLTDITAATPWR